MLTRVVFMGSPDFALPTLGALAQNYDVIGVITQPDRPAGRGRVLTPPPVKVLADDLDIPVFQPIRLRDSEVMGVLTNWNADLIVVAAFGQILPPEILDLPAYGCLNVHASLLPRWRGAAPIQAAILHGDPQTGVTIMKMDEGLDTGPLLSQRALPISAQETAGSLSAKLAHLGAESLIETIPAYLNGNLQPKPQQGESTYAPMLKKSDGELDFTLPALNLERKIRAFDPWPGTFMNWNNQRLIIHRARITQAGQPGDAEYRVPGDHLIIEDSPAIMTGEGIIIFEELQPAGKKPMPGPVFIRGAQQWV